MKKTYTTAFMAIALSAFVLSMGTEAYADEQSGPRARISGLRKKIKSFEPAAIGTICDENGQNCYNIGSPGRPGNSE